MTCAWIALIAATPGTVFSLFLLRLVFSERRPERVEQSLIVTPPVAAPVPTVRDTGLTADQQAALDAARHPIGL